jgi:hypothetical protein
VTPRQEPKNRKAKHSPSSAAWRFPSVTWNPGPCRAAPAGKNARPGRRAGTSGGYPVAILSCCTRCAIRSIISDLWSYGDSNPRPLACHRKSPGFTGLRRAHRSQRQRPSRLRPRPAAVKKRGRPAGCGPGESASANDRSHGHPTCCPGSPRDARCRRVASRPTVN